MFSVARLIKYSRVFWRLPRGPVAVITPALKPEPRQARALWSTVVLAALAISGILGHTLTTPLYAQNQTASDGPSGDVDAPETTSTPAASPSPSRTTTRTTAQPTRLEDFDLTDPKVRTAHPEWVVAENYSTRWTWQRFVAWWSIEVMNQAQREVDNWPFNQRWENLARTLEGTQAHYLLSLFQFLDQQPTSFWRESAHRTTLTRILRHTLRKWGRSFSRSDAFRPLLSILYLIDARAPDFFAEWSTWHQARLRVLIEDAERIINNPAHNVSKKNLLAPRLRRWSDVVRSLRAWFAGWFGHTSSVAPATETNPNPRARQLLEVQTRQFREVSLLFQRHLSELRSMVLSSKTRWHGTIAPISPADQALLVDATTYPHRAVEHWSKILELRYQQWLRTLYKQNPQNTRRQRSPTELPLTAIERAVVKPDVRRQVQRRMGVDADPHAVERRVEGVLDHMTSPASHAVKRPLVDPPLGTAVPYTPRQFMAWYIRQVELLQPSLDQFHQQAHRDLRRFLEAYEQGRASPEASGVLGATLSPHWVWQFGNGYGYLETASDGVSPGDLRNFPSRVDIWSGGRLIAENFSFSRLDRAFTEFGEYFSEIHAPDSAKPSELLPTSGHHYKLTKIGEAFRWHYASDLLLPNNVLPARMAALAASDYARINYERIRAVEAKVRTRIIDAVGERLKTTIRKASKIILPMALLAMGYQAFSEFFPDVTRARIEQSIYSGINRVMDHVSPPRSGSSGANSTQAPTNDPDYVSLGGASDPNDAANASRRTRPPGGFLPFVLELPSDVRRWQLETIAINLPDATALGQTAQSPRPLSRVVTRSSSELGIAADNSSVRLVRLVANIPFGSGGTWSPGEIMYVVADRLRELELAGGGLSSPDSPIVRPSNGPAYRYMRYLIPTPAGEQLLEVSINMGVVTPRGGRNPNLPDPHIEFDAITGTYVLSVPRGVEGVYIHPDHFSVAFVPYALARGPRAGLPLYRGATPELSTIQVEQIAHRLNQVGFDALTRSWRQTPPRDARALADSISAQGYYRFGEIAPETPGTSADAGLLPNDVMPWAAYRRYQRDGTLNTICGPANAFLQTTLSQMGVNTRPWRGIVGNLARQQRVFRPPTGQLHAMTLVPKRSARRLTPEQFAQVPFHQLTFVDGTASRFARDQDPNVFAEQPPPSLDPHRQAAANAEQSPPAADTTAANPPAPAGTSARTPGLLDRIQARAQVLARSLVERARQLLVRRGPENSHRQRPSQHNSDLMAAFAQHHRRRESGVRGLEWVPPSEPQRGAPTPNVSEVATLPSVPSPEPTATSAAPAIPTAAKEQPRPTALEILKTYLRQLHKAHNALVASRVDQSADGIKASRAFHKLIKEWRIDPARHHSSAHPDFYALEPARLVGEQHTIIERVMQEIQRLMARVRDAIALLEQRPLEARDRTINDVIEHTEGQRQTAAQELIVSVLRDPEFLRSRSADKLISQYLVTPEWLSIQDRMQVLERLIERVAAAQKTSADPRDWPADLRRTVRALPHLADPDWQKATRDYLFELFKATKSVSWVCDQLLTGV